MGNFHVSFVIRSAIIWLSFTLCVVVPKSSVLCFGFRYEGCAIPVYGRATCGNDAGLSFRPMDIVIYYTVTDFPDASIGHQLRCVCDAWPHGSALCAGLCAERSAEPRSK